ATWPMPVTAEQSSPRSCLIPLIARLIIRSRCEQIWERSARRRRLRAVAHSKYISAARLIVLICVLVISGCQRQTRVVSRKPPVPPNAIVEPLPDNAPPQLKQMLAGAIAQAGVTTSYDPAYV